MGFGQCGLRSLISFKALKRLHLYNMNGISMYIIENMKELLQGIQRYY